MLVYLNGDYLDHARAAVSVDDRGFLFGDGVYEVTRARNGRLFEAGRHLRRLGHGLEALGIAPPAGFEPGGAALVEISDRLLRENGLTSGDALVYLQVTRGAAERTHHFPPAGTPPTVFLRTNRLALPDDVRARGATAITTPDLRWQRCDLKTVQLLPNVLAKEQAVAAGAFEAIFLRDGIVMEGASANLFAVIGEAVRTHPATERILPGITREVVLELAAEQGLSVIERPIAIEELPGASELFVTSTSTDVMPVVRLDGRVVGSGRLGPVARQLHAALRGRLERDTARAPAV
jgi:D-alanine transaminase